MSLAFLDTSAILALLNPADERHARARRGFDLLAAERSPLITTSLVLTEVYALLARRLGLPAVKAFRQDLAPLARVVWVEESVFEAGLDLLLERRKRDLSLVDAVSFLVMREHKVERAFALDAHFEDEGFLLVA